MLIYIAVLRCEIYCNKCIILDCVQCSCKNCKSVYYIDFHLRMFKNIHDWRLKKTRMVIYTPVWNILIIRLKNIFFYYFLPFRRMGKDIVSILLTCNSHSLIYNVAMPLVFLGVIRPVVRASTLTWFIIYIFIWHLQSQM